MGLSKAHDGGRRRGCGRAAAARSDHAATRATPAQPARIGRGSGKAGPYWSKWMSRRSGPACASFAGGIAGCELVNLCGGCFSRVHVHQGACGRVTQIKVMWSARSRSRSFARPISGVDKYSTQYILLRIALASSPASTSGMQRRGGRLPWLCGYNRGYCMQQHR